MGSYNLRCKNNHEFEGWFKNENSYQQQCAQNLIQCPLCANSDMTRLPSAPNIGKKQNQQKYSPTNPTTENSNFPMPNAENAQLSTYQATREILTYIKNNFENVGKGFSQIARKIHYNEMEAKNIYGQANQEEILKLHDEGIACNILPQPEKEN